MIKQKKYAYNLIPKNFVNKQKYLVLVLCGKMLAHAQERVLLHRFITLTDLQNVLQRENNFESSHDNFFVILFKFLINLLISHSHALYLNSSDFFRGQNFHFSRCFEYKCRCKPYILCIHKWYVMCPIQNIILEKISFLCKYSPYFCCLFVNSLVFCRFFYY